MTKEVFIRNPARQLNAHAAHEAYVPEHQRLMAEGKLSGLPKEGELLEYQAKIRAQALKDLQMAPKITVPSVGQQDLGWNKSAMFYDEPVMDKPVYDENLAEEDLEHQRLDHIRQQFHKEREVKQQDKSLNEKKGGSTYSPPNSLDQLSNNEVIIIVQNKVVFSSLEEELIKDKLASLIFEENISPDDILVIKRLPIHISINLS